MDGDAVTAEPSDEPRSLAEIFSNAFPYYLSMGMSYDEFWYGRPSLVRDYRKAFEMKRSMLNWQMWMQGLYICKALRCAPLSVGFAKEDTQHDEYPSQPLPLTAKEVREHEEAKERAAFEKMLAKMNRDSEQELKRRKEAEKGAR